MIRGKFKDRSGNIIYPATDADSVLVDSDGNSTNLNEYLDATYVKKEDIPGGVIPSSTLPKAAGEAAIGTELTFARGDHVHPEQTAVTGSSGSCTGLAAKAMADADGNVITSTYATKRELAEEVAGLVNSAPETLDTLQELAEALGNDPNFATTVANQIGQKADKSSIPAASTTTPKAPGTASAGSETAWTHGDHVHPLQTSVSGSSGSCTGNAATATKLAPSKTIQTNLASTAAASFDGSANVAPGVTGVLPIANGGTGSSTQNFVDLSNAQTITGQKTFTKNPIISYSGDNTAALVFKDPDWARGGTLPSATQIRELVWQDSNSLWTHAVNAEYDTSGNSKLMFRVWNPTLTTNTFADLGLYYNATDNVFYGYCPTPSPKTDS